MGALFGVTGAIGSGKSTFTKLLTDTTPDHAHYESGLLVAEIAIPFNAALKAELAYETTADDIELTNQVLMWLPDTIAERLHADATWSSLAITKRDVRAHPLLYEKLFLYLQAVKKYPHLLDHHITSENKKEYRALLQWLGGYLIAKIHPNIWYNELFRRIQQYDATKSLVVIGGVRQPSEAELIRQQDGIIIEIIRPHHTSDTKDVTENKRNLIKPDVTVFNDSTVPRLAHLAENIMNDAVRGRLQPRYVASLASTL